MLKIERITMSEKLDLNELSFEQDLKIDIVNIADEWMRTPALIQKYSKLTANAANKKEMAKASLEYIKANLDFDIRNNPENYDNLPTDPKTGVGKTTDKVVDSAIILEQSYQDANKKRINTIYEYTNAKVLLDTIECKIKAMEILTKLVLAGWYGEFKGGDQDGLKAKIDEVRGRYQEKNKLQTIGKRERKILKRSPIKKR